MPCRTVIDQASATGDGTGIIILKSIGKFLLMFGCSALIGIVMAVLSALVRPHVILHVVHVHYILPFQLTKHIALRRHPSLELPMILIFAFLPYFIAEGLNLSGVVLCLSCFTNDRRVACE